MSSYRPMSVALLLVSGLFAVDAGAQRQAGPIAGPPARPLFGLFEPTPTFLARVDRTTLDAAGPRVPIGEYHYSTALSPDGARLAVATGGPGGGIRIVDVGLMQVVRTVHAGTAPEAVAWLTPDRVVAALQCNPANSAGRGCAIVLVDAVTGAIVRRWPATEDDVAFLPFQPPLSPPKPVAITPRGVVFLLSHGNDAAPARLVLIDRQEEFHSLSLPPIRTGALAMSANGDRVFVAGPGAIVADVDLKTMSAGYHAVGVLQGRTARRRGIVSLGAGQVATAGEDVLTSGNALMRVPAGLTLLDTSTWRGRMVDPRAGAAALAAGTLLAYGGTLPGVVGYSADGRERFRLFEDRRDRESIESIHVDGRQAYVVVRSGGGATRVRVVDAVTGSVARDLRPSARLIDLVP